MTNTESWQKYAEFMSKNQPYEWDIVNADNEIIGKIYTPTNSRKIAFEKLKFKMPSTYHFVKLVKVQNMKRKNKNLGCDVELGGVGDTMKYGTILIVGGGLAYAMWKFNLFGGLRWLKDAARDLYKAPETIAKWTDAEIGTRVDQIDRVFNILKIKGDNFSVDYENINNEWQKLKQKAIVSYGKESYKKTFYESGKEYYLGSKPTKEKLMDELDKFKIKPLQALRALQTKKNFKLNAKWEVMGGLNCIPCLF